MLHLFKEVLAVLSPAQRRQFSLLQVMVVLRSLAEVIGVAAIAPFMLLVSDLERVHGEGRLAQLYRWSGIEAPEDFLIAVGIGTLTLLLLAAIASVVTTYWLLAFSNRAGAELSTRLYNYYMHESWLYHSQHNSASLSNRIAVEASRLTKGILTPMMLVNANAVLVVFMTLALCLVDPVITLIGVLVFGIAYVGTYRVVRRRISQNGKSISAQSGEHFRLMSEGFGGIRDLILRSAQASFVMRFHKTAKRLSYSQSRNAALAQVPRYVIELAAIGSMVLFVVYVMSAYQKDSSLILPMISVYGLAAFKLLPAFEKIYSGVATIKGSQSAFNILKVDLLASASVPTPAAEEVAASLPSKCIQLNHVSFHYPSQEAAALDDVSFSIPVGALVGIAGASGAGKSTLIDVLLGLIAPQSGNILLDGTALGPEHMRGWRQAVSYIPQSIFLADTGIAANIAFGTAAPVDMQRVIQAAKAARLHEFICTLPDGYDTSVGEHGVRLSGGQRQRIGIARAAYHDSRILILDEATNSLDAVTESEILKSLLHGSNSRTAVMVTHKLSTIRQCDVIIFMDHGRVADIGSYDELIERNDTFRRLAWLS